MLLERKLLERPVGWFQTQISMKESIEVRRRILKSIWSLTRSQCKCCNMGGMCSAVGVLQIINAAEFFTN